MHNAESCRVLGSLLLLKAGVQNEGKETQVIQAFPCSLGHGWMPARHGNSREVPYKSIWSGHRQTVARDQLGAI